MPTSLWAIAIGSTLAWALFDVVRKRLVETVPVAALAFWLSVAQVPGYVIWLLLVPQRVPDIAYAGPAGISIVLNLLANLFFLASMKRIPMSTGIPLLSFTPVFVAVSSIPLLGEYLEVRQWLGVLLVTLGAFVLTAPPEAGLSLRRIVRSFWGNRGAMYMVAVAVLWALTPIFDKLALRHAGVGLHGLVLAVGVALGMGVVLWARSQLLSLRIAPQRLPLLAVGGGINVLALGLQLFAISAMVVSVFEAFKRAAGLLLAMILGQVLFRERLSAHRIVAGGMMATGVVLVLL